MNNNKNLKSLLEINLKSQIQQQFDRIEKLYIAQGL